MVKTFDLPENIQNFARTKMSGYFGEMSNVVHRYLDGDTFPVFLGSEIQHIASEKNQLCFNIFRIFTFVFLYILPHMFSGQHRRTMTGLQFLHCSSNVVVKTLKLKLKVLNLIVAV